MTEESNPAGSRQGSEGRDCDPRPAETG